MALIESLTPWNVVAGFIAVELLLGGMAAVVMGPGNGGYGYFEAFRKGLSFIPALFTWVLLAVLAIGVIIMLCLTLVVVIVLSLPLVLVYIVLFVIKPNNDLEDKIEEIMEKQ